MKRSVAAAFLTVCMLLSLLVVPAAAAGGYSDVPEGDWAAEVIEKATAYGLIEGKGDGTFGYGEYMNRSWVASWRKNTRSASEAAVTTSPRRKARCSRYSPGVSMVVPTTSRDWVFL